MNGIATSRCPPLVTFREKPTWVNRAGRVDRSACLEVRASEVRRLVMLWRWVRPEKQDESVPHAEVEGEVELTGRFLRKLESHRLPFKLMGDLRTRKSNAMKDPPRKRERSEQIVANSRAAEARNSRAAEARDSRAAEARGSGARTAPEHNRGLPARGYARGSENLENASNGMFNPNHGASRTKLLGFFADPSFMSGWSQRVRIVRWRSHEKLAQHFLICPSCEWKFLKLFAVLCSKQELEDAVIAESWIESIEARHAAAGKPMDAQVIEFRAQLISRYGLLFRRRRLVCRKCLGVRYGEVKKRATKASKDQGIEEDAAREHVLREAERRRRRREQSRDWSREVRKGFAELEKMRAAVARMKKMERLALRFEKEGNVSMRRAIERRLRKEEAEVRRRKQEKKKKTKE